MKLKGVKSDPEGQHSLIRRKADLSAPERFYARGDNFASSNLFKVSNRDGGVPLFQFGQDHGRRSGVMSDSLEYENYRIMLRDALNETYPAKIGEDGFARVYPATRSFDALESVTNYGFKPLTTPPPDNVVITDALGVTTTGFVDKDDERIFKALFRCMFGEYNPHPYYIAKDSSTGFPMHMSKEESKDFKLVTIHTILNELDEILELIDDDDIDALSRRYGMVVCYKNGTRAQPEARSKERKVRLADGSEVIADKISALQAIGLQRSGAMRMRTVFGMCAAINYLLSCFMNGRRQTYLHKYEFTWHHTGPHQIHEKIQQYNHIVGVDVTQMDQAMPSWFLEVYADMLEEIWDPRLVKLVRWVNKAPYFQSSVDGISEPFFMGDPADMSTWDVNVGLASGRFDVPDMGKLWMMFNYIRVMNKIVRVLTDRPSEDDGVISDILSGKHPLFACLNMGDDNVFCLHDGATADLLRERLASGEASPYCKMDVEDGVAFVGNVFMKDGAGKILIPKPDIVSMVVNRLCPEHGVNSNSRQFWGAGFMSALVHYEAIGPEARDVQWLLKDLWKYSIPNYPDPFQCATDHIKKTQAPIAGNLVDAEIMMDPTKRFYKYADAAVSQEIHEMFSWSVEADLIDIKIKPFHRNIITYATKRSV